MSRRRTDVAGFSLVEVVIAMLLLAVIAIAILPAMWQGLRYSGEQSSTATATRYMNSIVEDARNNPTCAYLNTIPSRPAVPDGRGVLMTTSTSTVTCVKGTTAKLTLNIVGDGRTLATSVALVYIP